MEKRNIIKYLDDNYSNLTESQKVLGRYVLDNYREVAFMSAIELGNKLGFSDATVIRFTQALGYQGFSDFRNEIRESIKKQDTPDMKLYEILKTPQEYDMITRVYEADLQNLQDYISDIDTESITRSVNYIYEADTIYFVGLGSSAVVIDFLSWHMRRMGFKVLPIKEGGLVLIDLLSPIKKSDLLILCTFPRYSKDTRNAVQLSKKKSAKIIAITDTKISDISKDSDVVLTVGTKNPSFFNSYVAPMQLCNTLILSILERNKEQIYNNLKASIKVMDDFDLYI